MCRSLEHAEKNDVTLSGGNGFQVNGVQLERKPTTNLRANEQGLNCRASNQYHGKDPCPAVGKTCFSCSELNHLAAACSKRKMQQKNLDSVRTEVTTINGVETPTVVGKKFPEMKGNLYDHEGRCLGTSITAVLDSGAETSIMGTNVLNELGISSLITEMPEKIIAMAADGLKMKIDGIFTARVEYRGKSVDPAFLVCPQHKGMLLAWEKCVALDVLPATFPTPLRLASEIPYGSASVRSVEIDVGEKLQLP